MGPGDGSDVVEGQNGADTVTANDMSGTDFRRADVDLSAPPAPLTA